MEYSQSTLAEMTSTEARKLSFMTATRLPRGGMVLLTSGGLVQFGAPPETIKDSIGTPDGVAGVFVLTGQFFNYERGISFAETEFPIYFNFFIHRKRLRLVCTVEQRRRVEQPRMASSILSPPTRTLFAYTRPASEMTATSVVPPPMSMIMFPEGSVIGRPAPIAAATTSGSPSEMP